MSWFSLWFHQARREAFALLLAVVVLTVSGPLGLRSGGFSPSMMALASLAVGLLSLWTGFRPAMLLVLGVLSSSLLWQGFEVLTVFALVYLLLLSYAATLRLTVIGEERRRQAGVIRKRQEKLKALEVSVDRLRREVDDQLALRQSRIRLSARSVALASFAKNVLSAGILKSKIAKTFEALLDLLSEGSVMLFYPSGEKFLLVKVEPKSLSHFKGKSFFEQDEPFVSLLEQPGPRIFQDRFSICSGLTATASLTIPLDGESCALIFVDWGDPVSAEKREDVRNVLETSFAAIELGSELSCSQGRYSEA